MTDRIPQISLCEFFARYGHRIAATIAVLAGVLAFAPAASAQDAPADSAPQARPGDSVYTMGPVEYRPARGFRFGDTGLTIGGFGTFEVVAPQDDPDALALDGPNLLILFEPFHSIRFFAELEGGDFFAYEFGERVDSSPVVKSERLYAEYNYNDAVNFRLGKFQTPVGHWNLIPAEPFVWTPSQPAILEVGLGEESLTGAVVYGTIYPGSRRLSYWLFGQFVDSFNVESDENPPDRDVGGRLEYGEALGAWTLGASLLASGDHGDWSTMGGLDLKLRIGDRLEISSEFLYSGGDLVTRDFWGVFVEGAYRLDFLPKPLKSLYWVTRLEHFDGKGNRASQIADIGFAWLPRDWLILKTGYRLSTRQVPDVDRGFIGSISVVF